MAEISAAFVTIAPSMRGFRRTVTTEAQRSGDAAGREFGNRFYRGADGRMRDSLTGRFAKQADLDAAGLGDKVGGSFGRRFAGRVQEFTSRVAENIKRGLIAAGIAGGFLVKSSIDEAANLEQSVGAIETVFKRSSGQMLTWSKQAARSVGLSKNEFNELGTLIGSQLKNGGTAMDQLAPKTNKLITLGADLSSMFGGTTREAVEALSSALKGERDPIERYGVSLNQAKIDAEATALGFKKVGNSFDTQAQQAATLSLIYKQTADAQGNFGRETDTTAHKQQVLAARFDNLKARIGKGLLPVYNTLLDFTEQRLGPAFRSVTDAVRPVVREIGDRLAPVIERVTDFMRANPAVVKAFAIALGILAAAIGVVTLATTAFSIALNSTGIPLVIIAIAALVAGLVYAYQHSEQFRAIVDEVGAVLRSFAGWVRDEVIPAVVDLAQKVATNLQPVWQALAEFFTGTVLPIVDKAVAKFQEWQPVIQRVAGIVLQLVAKWVDFYTTMLGKVLPVVIKVAGFIIRNLVSALVTMAGRVAAVIGFLVSFGRGVSNAGKSVGEFARKVADKIAKVVQWISELPGKAVGALGDVSTLLSGAGKQIMNSLWDGLKDVWEDIKGWLSNVTKEFPKRKGPPAKDKKLLYKSGLLIMGGLRSGLKSGFGAIETVLDRITDRLGNFIDKKKVGKKLAKKMQGVVAQIAQAAQGLQDAIQARNDLAGSVASNLMGEFNLSDIFGKNQFGLSLGLDSAVQVAQSIVARMRAFAQKLTALVAAGLPPGLVQEVAGLGSVEGARVADAFLQGGSFLQGQFTAAYNDLKAVTGAAGLTVGNATYGVDIERLEDLFAGALERGLAKLGLAVTVGVGKETSMQIVQQGTKHKKKRK